MNNLMNGIKTHHLLDGCCLGKSLVVFFPKSMLIGIDRKSANAFEGMMVPEKTLNYTFFNKQYSYKEVTFSILSCAEPKVSSGFKHDEVMQSYESSFLNREKASLLIKYLFVDKGQQKLYIAESGNIWLDRQTESDVNFLDALLYIKLEGIKCIFNGLSITMLKKES